jgi:phospholipase/carboxylesterase
MGKTSTTAGFVMAALLVGCGRKDPPPVPTPSATVNAAPVTSAASQSPARACAPAKIIAIPARDPPAEATLVMLHGYGSNAENVEPVARELALVSPKLAVLVPDGCDPSGGNPNGRQWLEGGRGAPESQRAVRLARAGQRVESFVFAELDRRGFPRDRVVWAGFSQGAMLAQWMAVHATPRPLAVISFSGRFDDADPPGAPVGTPVLVVHGTDDQMIAFNESQRAEAALVARGARVEHIDRPGMGHAIDAEARAAGAAFLKRVLR